MTYYYCGANSLTYLFKIEYILSNQYFVFYIDTYNI